MNRTCDYCTRDAVLVFEPEEKPESPPAACKEHAGTIALAVIGIWAEHGVIYVSKI